MAIERIQRVSKLEDFPANASQEQINAAIKRNQDHIWRRMNVLENRLDKLEKEQ